MTTLKVPRILLFAESTEETQILFIALQGFAYMPTKCHEVSQCLDMMEKTEPACVLVEMSTQGSEQICGAAKKLGKALVVMGDSSDAGAGADADEVLPSESAIVDILAAIRNTLP